VVEPLISAYVHVNAVGGLRFFYQFENAINNNRSAELTLTNFAGAATNHHCKSTRRFSQRSW
jgi:hypothetical protein